MRGILAAALAALTLLPVVPATAAASPYVVYEAYRVKKNGPSQVPIRVYGDGGRMLTATQEIAPADEGGYRGYSGGWYLGEFSPQLWTFRPQAGHRFFFAGPRGRLRFLSLSGYWRVKPTTLGFRVVAPSQDVRDRNFAGTGFDIFHSATAPAGKYGSQAYVTVPCSLGAGQWELTAGGTKVNSGNCAFDGPSLFPWTSEPGPWKLTGTLLDQPDRNEWYRFIVLDFPKR